ncbi:MAG: ATP-binding protein [Oligoflexia bacterium]|nr:ATP-binding protein [Oligoflexia bacterium]
MANEDLELRKAFFTESVDILESIEEQVSVLEVSPGDLENVNGLFRGLHTIKGNSSFLSLDSITKVSHAAETLLDKARKKEIPVDKVVVALVKKVLSCLQSMIMDQNTDLDVSEPVSLISKFLKGEKIVIDDNSIVDEKNATQVANQKIQTTKFIKIDDVKVNKLVSITRELELLRYSLEKTPEKMEVLGPQLDDLRFEVDLLVSKMSRLTRSLSGIMFGIRLVPVGQVFNRFPKVVKELAAKLGKDIRLEIKKGNAELDKNIVEAIADPMTHLIRNSADHGIETLEDRKRSRKKAQGVITLDSYVRGNFVFIEISDDGKGIDGDKILEKAIEKGIVPKDKVGSYTNAQKLSLIFAPGFSTAEKVTDISGRGVGMDVVKSNINKLKGTVLIESEPGKGTVIRLRFPMSLVVMFSLFVEISDSCYGIPVEQIDESIDYNAGEFLNEIPQGSDPSKFMEVYSIRSLLWGQQEDAKKSLLHTLKFKAKSGENKLFLVDEFLSIEDAIVQSLDSYIAAMPGLQGATVRKDGSVATILNPDSLLDIASKVKPFAFVPVKEKDKTEDVNLADFLGFSDGSSVA